MKNKNLPPEFPSIEYKEEKGIRPWVFVVLYSIILILIIEGGRHALGLCSH